MANRIVLVTQLTVPALRSTQRTIGVCRRLGYDDSKLCVVVNRYQSGDVLPVKDAEDLLQAPIYWKLPNDYKTSAASLTKGLPVVLDDPGSRLAKSYVDLVKKLNGSAGSGGFPRLQDGGGASRFRKLFGNDKGVRNVS
jgi:pilus assembly protein CpaE